MATVTCSVCGKENEPSGNWNYCRGCGGRLALPVAQTTVISAEGGNEAVTATAVRPATAKRVPVAESAPRRAKPTSNAPKKTVKEIQQEMRWWSFGLVLVSLLVGMIIGSVLKKNGVQYGLLDDPLNMGAIGGIMFGALIAQILIWIKQGQQG